MEPWLLLLNQPTFYIGLALGAIIVGVAMFVHLRSRTKQQQQQLQQARIESEKASENTAALHSQAQQTQHELELKNARFEERLTHLQTQLLKTQEERGQLERKLEQALFQLADRNEVLAEVEARFESEQQAHKEKLKLLEQAKGQLTQEFQLLANRIFDEKAQRLNDANKEHMGHLLNPLKQQLGDFKRRVEDVYDKEAKDRRALHEQIGHLKQLNQQMSEDAINLTNALKGENKAQGNWGEFILERALEASGLRKGYEFDLQVAVSEAGKRYQPDAIIHLPDQKKIIVDAKMSLKAYEQYCACEDELLREKLLREHLLSVKGHIKGLSEKAYQSLLELQSLDFVLLFIPVEGAFLLALEKEPNLFKDAFDRNIMLVSPATLMVTLRTIHNIWRYEHQNQNAKEIARRGGELHDKFVGFVGALDEIGRNLERTQQAFDTAHKRLISGRGNLVNQAATLQELGAAGKKSLAADLIEQAKESDAP